MKTIKKLISEINFQDKKIQTNPNWESLSEEFNLNLCWSEDTRLKAYRLKTWICTDTWVGWIAYFLDEEFVVLSSQNARKNTIFFEFESSKKAEKVRKYLQSLIEIDDNPNVPILNMEEEVGDKYQIDFNSQILHKTAWLGDKKVNIKKTMYPYSEKEKYFHTVEIEYQGEVKEVDCRELLFDYNTLD